MQSEIEFQFSHDIFMDTGSLYSPEYISGRQMQKTEFLKHLDITPSLPITEDQLILTPNRVAIVGDFHEGTRYRIQLKDIIDIYGRTQDLDMYFEPKSEPFLSLGLP